MQEKQDSDDSKAIALLAEMGGASVGALIGSFGGPAGVIIGAAAGPVITRTTHVAMDIIKRHLSQREQVRVATTFTIAVEKIKQNIAAGQKARQDGFFQPTGDNRPAADEIAEGILLSAQREYEERKIVFLGNLLANIAFHQEIDRALAVNLISAINSLSYQQLCFISLVAQKDILCLTRGYGVMYFIESELPRVNTLGQNVYDLYQRNVMLRIIGESVDREQVYGRLSPFGLSLFILAELGSMGKSDLDDIISIIREYNKEFARSGMSFSSYPIKEGSIYKTNSIWEGTTSVFLKRNDEGGILCNDAPVRSSWHIGDQGVNYTVLVTTDDVTYCVETEKLRYLDENFL